jgi:preprotein translocase subunit SecF
VLELLKNPRFDFMGWSKFFVTLSIVGSVVSLILVPIKGLKMGIEFTGGTEMQFKYATTPDVAQIRAALEHAGLAGPIVTTIGGPAENEVYIRLAGVGENTDVTGQVVRALRGEGAHPDRVDVNVADRDTLAGLLKEAPGMTAESAKAAAQAISERRKEAAIFRSLDEVAAAGALGPEVRAWLADQTDVGPLSLRSRSYIGPAIGGELIRKTMMAVVLSLGLMLVYIWIRFQVQWGIAAVLALVHDTTMTLGLFVLFDKEMSLPVVAAFLTLIGYSTNDTVVVFDRIREMLRNKPGGSLSDVINTSINQTLSRTVITSGLTWVCCLSLYLFGGPALNPFAFVMTVGIIVGTYSSIFIASPLLVLWSRFVGGRPMQAAAAAPSRSGGSRKVGRSAKA